MNVVEYELIRVSRIFPRAHDMRVRPRARGGRRLYIHSLDVSRKQV